MSGHEDKVSTGTADEETGEGQREKGGAVGEREEWGRVRGRRRRKRRRRRRRKGGKFVAAEFGKVAGSFEVVLFERSARCLGDGFFHREPLSLSVHWRRRRRRRGGGMNDNIETPFLI